MISNVKKLSSSFRDPSGFLFLQDGSLYRQVNSIYKENYNHLIDSGLYKKFVDAKLLIPHTEVNIEGPEPDRAYKIIKPEIVPFISYPYEWCFSQLKDAALTTLEIQRQALNFGMSLKDASAYNIQFRNGKPLLIDSLSFEDYHEGEPWIAYRQFCQHFLAPLSLMSYRDVRLNQLLRTYIDGVPLDLASALLPFDTRFKFSLLSHIHLHARSQRYFADKTVNTRSRRISRFSLLSIIDSLDTAVRKLNWQAQGTEWGDYYDNNINYSSDGLRDKKRNVADFLSNTGAKIIWDLGANVGTFSQIGSDKGIQTISFDIDSGAVEKNYLHYCRKGETYILPLLLDLTNPSPGIGWNHQERMSLMERGPADVVLALALIHHLAISNNLPFHKIADFFCRICRDALIIEFVPKNDSQVQRLLATREDIFSEYTQQTFENEFGKHFAISSSVKIKDSDRILYLMKRRQS